MQDIEGGSLYLRLSTRVIAQPDREMTPELENDILKGAYWQIPPDNDTELVIAYCGPVAPEVLEAYNLLVDEVPGLGILAIPSSDRLYHDWQRSMGLRGQGCGDGNNHLSKLLKRLNPRAGLVTVQDGHPASLSWIGSATGRKVYPLGVADFGQSGDLPDLYRTYRIDSDAIVDMAASACIDIAGSG